MEEKFWSLYASCYETGMELEDIMRDLGIVFRTDVDDKGNEVNFLTDEEYCRVIDAYEGSEGPFEKAVREFAEENEYCFEADYSGRCMFGRTCCGVVGPKIMGMQFIAFLYETDRKDLVPQAMEAAWDSMGLQSIMYFPNV